jgi:hypothetical protein
MKQANFPEGWDEERVRRVLEHYENQSDEEALADTSGCSKPRQRRARRDTRRRCESGDCRWDGVRDLATSPNDRKTRLPR